MPNFLAICKYYKKKEFSEGRLARRPITQVFYYETCFNDMQG